MMEATEDRHRVDGTFEMSRKKVRAASASVATGAFLTGLKVAFGVYSGSLAILAEAAHSALDLVAAVITLIAVRTSDRPPDRLHPYGHGKAENLAAFCETLLLYATCAWILKEAVSRFRTGPVELPHLEVGIAILAASILLDYTRSRALSRVAEASGSQALAADALHFSTDLWSSAVALAGVGLVMLSEPIGWPGLGYMDAAAGAVVAVVTIYLSTRLGFRSVSELLDSDRHLLGPRAASAIEGIEGVEGPVRVRVRHSGPHVFGDVILSVRRDLPLEKAHRVADAAEEQVRSVAGDREVDVTVHVEPTTVEENLAKRLEHVARMAGGQIHHIRLYRSSSGLHADLHVEVDEDVTLVEAHRRTAAIEDEIVKNLPQLKDLTIHIEPVEDLIRPVKDLPSEVTSELKERVLEAAAQFPSIQGCAALEAKQGRQGLLLSVTFLVDASTPLSVAHTLSHRLEAEIVGRMPDLWRIAIHMEPAASPESSS